jgi:hypothetical protein
MAALTFAGIMVDGDLLLVARAAFCHILVVVINHLPVAGIHMAKRAFASIMVLRTTVDDRQNGAKAGSDRPYFSELIGSG